MFHNCIQYNISLDQFLVLLLIPIHQTVTNIRQQVQTIGIIQHNIVIHIF
jgi:hypothetical protein